MRGAALALALLLVPSRARAQAGWEAPPQARFEPPRGLSAKLSAGPAYRRVFEVPIAAVDVAADLGWQSAKGAVYGGAEFLFGRTEFGLATQQLRTSLTLEARADRVRFGIALDVTYFAVKRVTSGGEMDQVGLGGSLLWSVDLARTEAGRALYLGAALGGDWLNVVGGSDKSPFPFVWGPTLRLGARY